jgi:hypothetical protein
MENMKNAYKIVFEKPEDDHFEDLGVDRWIILEWSLKKWRMRV